jgi:SAM-dependent methyltransferase
MVCRGKAMIRCPTCKQLHASTFSRCSQCGFSLEKIAGFPAWAPDLAKGGEGFRVEDFALLAAVEADYFWFRARNELIIWAIRSYFPALQSFMEIGCGTGFVLSGIARAFPLTQLYGSEVFIEGLAIAARRVQTAKLMQMDARHIPYEDEFDAMGAFDVLEHIDDDKAVLANMSHATRAGGGIILTVPQHQWLWSSVDDSSCHVRRYSCADLHAKIHAAGFEIVRSTSFVSLLLPAMLLSRRRGMRDKPFNPMDEFHISPFLNRLLEIVLDSERSVIRAGLDLPIGGSRLIVAKKVS